MKKQAPKEKFKSLTAGQRLENLEKVVGTQAPIIDMVPQSIQALEERINKLGKIVETMLDLFERDVKVTKVEINKAIMDSNIQELKNRVDVLLQQGVLEVAETITENSFIVGSEFTKDNEVISQRTQFPMSNVTLPELKEVLMGKKVGDKVSTADGAINVLILEVYAIKAA